MTPVKLALISATHSSRPETDWRNRGPREPARSSRRGNRGAVELRRNFHPHDFKQHANPPAVVQMREPAKRLREWPRHDAHLLADLESVIEQNGLTGPA